VARRRDALGRRRGLEGGKLATATNDPAKSPLRRSAGQATKQSRFPSGAPLSKSFWRRFALISTSAGCVHYKPALKMHKVLDASGIDVFFNYLTLVENTLV
jgi:hypothetical protein